MYAGPIIAGAAESTLGGAGLSIPVAMRLYRGFRTISIAILALILV